MTYVLNIKPPTIENYDFINLTHRKFAEFEIVFRVNDGYKLKNIGDFRFKEQLLFQRFKNKTQQLNLMLIDSIFPIILAGIALLVLLGKIKNLNDYINSKERIIFPLIINDKIYFERKVMDFINGLLYGDVGGKLVWKGDSDNRRVFCIKNSNDELDFYSIYDRHKIIQLLAENMKTEISENQITSIKGNLVNISLILRL